MIKENNGFNQSFLQNEQKAPILALEKSKKISQKSRIIPYGGQTVHLTAKSDKKPNDLHEIPYLVCGLRFRFRPTVHPQFTKIGGTDGCPKKIFAKIFLAFLQYFGPINTILLKNFFEFLILSGSDRQPKSQKTVNNRPCCAKHSRVSES